LRLWEGDFAIASVALSATLDSEGRWRGLRLVFGGLAPVPWRAWRTEARLEGRVASVAELRSMLDEELDAAAHPLPRNGWKLDAAAGLAERATEALMGAERRA
jgi:CO/xanthine dehydrogenase FAD-binding subunit